MKTVVIVTHDPCTCSPKQLRKPVSTLSIPGTIKSSDRNREDEGALVGVHSEFPRYGDEKRKGSSLVSSGLSIFFTQSIFSICVTA